jgi:hypothetical protein
VRRITPYSLWLGHAGDAQDLRGLFAAGIRALVDVALNESPGTLARELVYCRFPLLDGAGNPPWLLRSAIEMVAGLVRSATPTLVYCGAGMSRSPAIAAAALARAQGRPLAECLRDVVQCGPCDLSPALWRDVVELLGA